MLLLIFHYYSFLYGILQTRVINKTTLWGGVATRLLTRCWSEATHALHLVHLDIGLEAHQSTKRIADSMAALLPWDVS